MQAINKQETSGYKWQDGSSNRKMMNMGDTNSTKLEDETKALIKTLKHKNLKKSFKPLQINTWNHGKK